MTPPFSDPTPADIAQPRDPGDYGLRRRGFGAAFWACIILCFLCALAGAGVARFGPALFPPRPSPRPTPAAVPVTPAPGAPAPAPAQALTPTPAAAAAPSGELQRLENGQRRVTMAAGEALAAADLSEAAQGSRPFAADLTVDARLLPDGPDLQVLRGLAEVGAPSRAALAQSLSGLADRAAVASREPAPKAGLLSRLTHALDAVFTLRRVDRLTGDSPDAILNRAQQQADDGDLGGALHGLGGLPAPGQAVLAEWRARAERRVEIDRRIASLRAAAVRDMADLAAAGASGTSR